MSFSWIKHMHVNVRNAGFAQPKLWFVQVAGSFFFVRQIEVSLKRCLIKKGVQSKWTGSTHKVQHADKHMNVL